MPSNKDLKTDAVKLGVNLGVNLNLDGLSNNKLAQLVSDLKAKIKDRDTVTQADIPPAPPVPPTPDVKVEPPAPDVKVEPPASDVKVEPSASDVKVEPSAPDGSFTYKVARGKAITCKKGVLGPGDEVKIEYVEGGSQSLNTLFKRGYLVKE